MEQKIKKDITIGELIQKYPETAETLMELGLHCIGCHVSAFESLEDGFKAHGMEDKEVDEAVKKLNEVIGKKEE